MPAVSRELLLGESNAGNIQCQLSRKQERSMAEAASNPKTQKPAKANGQQKGQPRVISNPNDVAGLVMMQIDNINAKKDDLTIAIKGITDTAKQLVRAYAQQQQVIAKLAKKVEELEKAKV
jgi:hypothetical protein